MASGLFLWQSLQRQPTTLISAAYGADGSLQENVIAGPTPPSACLPDEGVYILFRSRALQIAAPCNRRKCNRTQVCRCPGQHAADADDTTPRTDVRQVMMPALSRYRFRMHFRFREAVAEIRRLQLCFLARPRALSRSGSGGASPSDGLALFHFDGELARCAETPWSIANVGAEERLVSAAQDTWADFLGRGDHRHGLRLHLYIHPPEEISARQAYNNDGDGGDEMPECYSADEMSEWDHIDEISEWYSVDEMSDWDDADIPVTRITALVSPSNPPVCEDDAESDFDLIDDLIDDLAQTEFPRLTTSQQGANEGVVQQQHAPPQQRASPAASSGSLSSYASATVTAINPPAGDETSPANGNPEGERAQALPEEGSPPAPATSPPDDAPAADLRAARPLRRLFSRWGRR
ncbi:hypothetical protein SAMD00023353_1900790 [Rosellinia necatrix]|uniref:Uncharacterized protein n=1 Tax=Rosellinia necatrix TaxID=77044 RepID=A0A1W2TEN8_ROSNE|nr:hypothetical protein SAMD00023353_1900790 [Rosellinia necatrix]